MYTKHRAFAYLYRIAHFGKLWISAVSCRHLILPIRCGSAASIAVGNRDAAGFSDPLDAGRDIDAVAKNIVALNDNIAAVDADPELDRIGLRAARIKLPKLSLNFNGAGDGVHRAGELHQRAVAHELDDPSCMGGNRRINKPTPQGIQTGKSPGLVETHEARVTDHVGR